MRRPRWARPGSWSVARQLLVLQAAIVGLLVAAGCLGYGMSHRGEVNEQAKPEATVGSTR